MRLAVGGDAITVATEGLDELEIYVDGRPTEGARKISDGEQTVARPERGVLDIVGRRLGVVRQRRRLSLS